LSFEVITVPPTTGKAPKGLVVALHGWGANAEDLAGLVPLMNMPDYQFIFPNAPYPYPYSATGRAWYELRSENSYQGLMESRQLLNNWLPTLEASTGVPLSRTVLLGFSQGAAMTMDVGLHLPLAGLVALSGYLHPIADMGQRDFTTCPPILLVHGRQDAVVPIEAAENARTTLEALGVRLDYHEFDMGHEIRPQVLPLIRNFVVGVIPA
jgi:phospholipase/carboxylesterase